MSGIAHVLVVTLSDGTRRGRGEASRAYHPGDDVAHTAAALEGATRSRRARRAPGRVARRHGGAMVGTSLATAPGFVLGRLADLLDPDGPTSPASDRAPGVVRRDGDLFAGPEVWGTRQASAARACRRPGPGRRPGSASRAG